VHYVQRNSSISSQFSNKNIDQIEGEAQRLQFINNSYPELYQDALALFDKKIFTHLSLIRSLPKKEQYEYLSKLEYYIREFKVRQRHLYKVFIYEKMPLLSFLWKIKDRIKNELNNNKSNNWVKIKLNDKEYNI
jgi:hypothetical protein